MKTKYLTAMIAIIILIVLLPSNSIQAINAIFDWPKSPDNPVLTADLPWEGSSLGSTSVMYQDSEYKMWYSSSDGQIGYATSVDGLIWNKYASNPLLTSENEPPLVPNCDSLIGNPEVIFDGTEWKMWYSTGCTWGVGKFNYAISLATSTDGLTWTKYAGNPVFSFDNGWDRYSKSSPSVVYKDGIYHMWYWGSLPGLYDAIGYATSLDGINWTRYGDDPVIEANYSWDPDVIFHEDQYHIWYGNSRNILHATSWNGSDWVDDPNNPTLEPGPAGSWDEYYVWGPSVLFAKDHMRIWYSSNGQIGYAETESFTPELNINYLSGSQGSYFTITATRFIPESMATVIINGHTFTETVSIDQDGVGIILLDTHLANDGTYFVSLVSDRTSSVKFVIAATEPFRDKEVIGPEFVIPSGIAYTDFMYLPVINK